MRKDKEERLAAAAKLSESPDEVRKSNLRDTTSWCKGKRGREHKGEWFDTEHGWRHFICTHCGKFLGYDFGRFDLDRSGYLPRELRRLRKAMNITQEELSGLSGIAQETISGIETMPYYRRNEVRVSMWEKLFEALGQRLVMVVVPSEDAMRRMERTQSVGK